MRVLLILFLLNYDVLFFSLHAEDFTGSEVVRGEDILIGPIPGSNMFSGAPYTPGETQPLDAIDAPEIYTVQHGDTLIDICDQLLGKPGYWPRLWSLNPFIKNPHFVWPGMRLRFYPGSDDLPPFLEVLEDDDIVFLEDDIEEKQLLDIEIPEWRPFAPGSAELVGVEDLSSMEEGKISYSGPVAGDIPDVTTQPMFVVDQRIRVLGKVNGVGEGGVRFGRVIYIFPEEEIQLRKTYVLARPAKDVGRQGRRFYRYVGQMELLKFEGGRAWGRLQDPYLKVEPEDILIEYRNPKTQVPRFVDSQRTVKPGRSGKILAFASPGRRIGHSHNFVAVNLGRSDGVQAGNLLEVHRLMAGRLKSIGQLYVVEVSDSGGVAVVRPGAVEVLQGDLIIGSSLAVAPNNQ
ncbi:MAG: LysM peptidoglycan-binding domain-containing protein [Oligoflexales bacterium]